MKLELFYFDACPFCVMVLDVIQRLNIKVDMLDIWSNQEYAQRLMNDTGRRTVPCLYIDNKPMFESRDIIRWLEENLDHLEKNQD